MTDRIACPWCGKKLNKKARKESMSLKNRALYRLIDALLHKPRGIEDLRKPTGGPSGPKTDH